MILFSPRKAAHSIADGSLKSNEKIKYLMLPLIFSSISFQYFITPIYGAEPPYVNRIIRFLTYLISAYITYRGIKMCYLVNKNIDDSDFFERFAILFVPPYVWFIIVYSVVAIIYIFVVVVIQSINPAQIIHAPISLYIFYPIANYSFYVVLRNSFLNLGELITGNVIDIPKIGWI